VYRLLKEINSTGVTEHLKGCASPRSVRTWEFRKTWNICNHASTLHTHKSPYEIEREAEFHGHLLGALQSTILQLTIYSASQELIVIRYSAILFPRIVCNKLRINARNEITLICAKFGVDLINISKVTSRKTVAPFLCVTLHVQYLYK